MKALSNLRPFRFLLALFACTLIFCSSAFPALANPVRSQPTDGEVQLDETYEKSEEALKNPPKTLDEITKRSSEGLNEVQGAADLDKFESSSQKGPAIKQQIEKALEKVTK